VFWIATVTPCDRNLKFDPGAFKDILAWYKQNGAMALWYSVRPGSSHHSQWPSASRSPRWLSRTSWHEHDHRSGHFEFPETLELARHAQDNGADGLLVIPPFYYKKVPTDA